MVVAVVAAVGPATAATSAASESGSGSPKPAPRAVRAAAPQAGAPVFGTSARLAAGSPGSATVDCPAATAPTGSGGQTSGWDIFVTDSYASGNNWIIRGKNTGTATQSLTASVLCQ
ncbi:hypothetical protein [Streptomyces melanogenes]|uniref:hypothetical protein n=1 Tax=Streptomyces melanogenes TaxID=67326 RepID=UPI0037A5307B